MRVEQRNALFEDQMDVVTTQASGLRSVAATDRFDARANLTDNRRVLRTVSREVRAARAVSPQTAKDTPLVALLRELGSDGYISGADYNAHAAALVNGLPATSNRDTRALLEFWVKSSNSELGNGGIAFDGDVDKAIDAKLRSAGFDLPQPAQGRLSIAELPEVLERNSGKRRPDPKELRNLFTGREVDAKVWERELRPLVWRLPKTATAASRELVQIYGDPSVTMAPEVARELGGLLKKTGYPVDPESRPTREQAEFILRDAVHETDPVFAKYAQLTGRADAKTHIGVIDGGFDVRHPALAGKLAVNRGEVAGNGKDDDGNGIADDVHGYSAVTGDASLERPDGFTDHGNNVLGIATRGTKQIQATLVATEGSSVAQQIDYLAAQGARVINMSVNYPLPEHAKQWRAAMERHPEITFVVAAMNDGKPISELPETTRAAVAPLANLIVVTAADDRGAPVPGTNYGVPEVTVAARSKIRSAIAGTAYGTGSMTSMAAPNVTNVVAKCLTLDPALKPAELNALITGTAKKSEEWTGRVVAGGVLDEDRALATAAATALLRKGWPASAVREKLGMSAEVAATIMPLAETLFRKRAR